MRRVGTLTMCLALGLAGCMNTKGWLSEPDCPQQAVQRRPAPRLPPVLPDDVTAANAHAKAQALWDECDREASIPLVPAKCSH